MTQKENAAGPTGTPGVINVSESDARIVTPTEPLEIDYTPAEFLNVDIQGGNIYTKLKAQVTFKKLTKTS